MKGQRSRWTLFLLLFLLSGIYVFIFGESGLLERAQLEKNSGKIIKRIEHLKDEQKRLKHRYSEYAGGGRDYEDLLNSGYIRNDDRLIFFRDRTEAGTDRTDDVKQKKGFGIELAHLRIVWVIVSVLIALFFISRNRDRTGT